MTKRSPYALPEREPGAPYHPLDMLRSKRAVVDTGLAPIIFLVVNSFTNLKVAAAAAIGVAVLLMVERLVRRETPMNAIGGLLGTGIAVAIALRTGTVEGFFWPKVAQNGAYGLAFLVSILVRRPLLGLIAQFAYQLPSDYLKDPRVRPAYSVASFAWVLLFGVRAIVYTVAILAGKAEWLAAIVLVLGWPAFAGTVLFSFKYVTWRLEKSGAPDPEEFRAAAEARDREAPQPAA